MFYSSPTRIIVLFAAIWPSLAIGAVAQNHERVESRIEAGKYVQALQWELARHPGVRPALAAKVILVESHGQLDTPDGSRGEIGAMQIRPQTFAWVSRTILHKEDGELNPRRAEDNLAVGVSLLNWLLERYDHNEALTLIGYNAGMGTADRAKREIAEGGQPRIPATTRAYLRNILGPDEPTVGPRELLALADQPSEIETILAKGDTAVEVGRQTCLLADVFFQSGQKRVPVDASGVAVLALATYRRRLLVAEEPTAQDALQQNIEPDREVPSPPLRL